MQWIQAGLRFLQFLWTLFTTALIGNVIADAFAGNPSSINYAIFTSVFCWVAVLYGIAALFSEALAYPLILGTMDILATFLTFIAGVVLAAKLGVHSCSNKAYLISNSLTNGSYNMQKRCHELQASTAFYWFLFATFAASSHDLPQRWLQLYEKPRWCPQRWAINVAGLKRRTGLET